MMCTHMLHGGVCYRTWTPHKSGTKMKENKKEDHVTEETFLQSHCGGTVLATNGTMSGALSWEFDIVLLRSANESKSADAKRERMQPPCN